MSELAAGKPTAPGRTRLSAALRALLSLALLSAMYWKTPLADVARALRRLPASGVALALVVMALQLLVGALRWRRMLIRVGARQPLGPLVADILVGSAYNLILPSAVGGDVVRALRCSRRLAEAAHGFSTTLFERMVGVPTLALAAAPGILVVPGGRGLLAPALGIAALSALGIVFADAPFRLLGARLVGRAPAFAAVSSGVGRDLRGPLGARGARAEALGWTLLYQLLGLSILPAFVAPGDERSIIPALYAGVPLIALGSMLPITIGGFGLRESLFVGILGRLGVDRTTSLALGVLWLGSYVVLAIPGVALAMRSGPAPAAASLPPSRMPIPEPGVEASPARREAGPS